MSDEKKPGVEPADDQVTDEHATDEHGADKTTAISEAAFPAEPSTDELTVQRGTPVPTAPTLADVPTNPHTKVLPGDDFESFGAPALAGLALGSDPVAAGQPSGVVRTVPRPKRTWRTAALVTAAVLLLAVIAGVGTELYIRHKVTSCLETAFSNLTGTSTSVSIPRGPMLAAWFSGDVAWVQVDTNDSADSTAMRLHARANEVARDGRTAQSLGGTAYVPYSRVQELADQGGANGAATIDRITGSAGEGTVTVDSTYRVVFVSVPATVVMKPATVDGKVEFPVQEAKTFGIGLPADFAQQIVDQVTEGMFGPLFAQIKVDTLKVTDLGIEFAFSGQNVNLQAASTGTQNLSGTATGSCA